jgi:hypothetical protein
MSKQTDLINIPDAITVDGDNVGIGANSLSLGANNANSPQILFENSDGVTGDAALSTYDDASGTMLVMGSNFYINSSGSESRFNTSEESSAVMLNRNGDLNLLTGGTGATATTRLKIDSSGNVGIGTSSPVVNLHTTSGVARTSTAKTETAFFSTDDTDDFRFGLAISHKGGTTGNDRYASLDSTSYQVSTDTFSESGSLVLQEHGGNVGINTSSPSEKLQVESGVNSFPATSGSTQTGAALRLRGADNAVLDMGLNSVNTWIQATDKTALNSNYTLCLNPNGGNLLVGTTTTQSSYRMNIAPHSNGGFIAYRAASTANHYPATFINSSGSGVGNIVITTTATAYNTSSDYRLKTDAQPMTGASARVQALNPVNFEWIASGTRVDGFLAHEAQAVVPEAVSGTKDAMMDEEYEVTPAVLDDDGNVTTEAVMGTRSVPDYQGIDQSKLVPLLTAALQEALTEIASLKTRVQALEDV